MSASLGRSLAAEDRDIAIEVGKRIRVARQAASLTQAQLAAPRYTKAYISALENGLAKPSLAATRFLAGRLGRSAASFLEEAPAATIDGLHAQAARFAEALAVDGRHVSVRIFPPYGPEDDQPDPLVDVWR